MGARNTSRSGEGEGVSALQTDFLQIMYVSDVHKAAFISNTNRARTVVHSTLEHTSNENK